MEEKKTRGVNIENVIKLMQYLKSRKDEEPEELELDYESWSLDKWISYDNKCEW